MENGEYGNVVLFAIRNLPTVLADSATTLLPLVIFPFSIPAGIVVSAIIALDLVIEIDDIIVLVNTNVTLEITSMC